MLTMIWIPMQKSLTQNPLASFPVCACDISLADHPNISYNKEATKTSKEERIINMKITKGNSHITYMLLLILATSICIIGNSSNANAKTKRLKVDLYLGQTRQLANNGVQSFESKDETIVTVTKKGKIHGLKAGRAKIIAKTETEKRIYRITVKKRGLVYPTFSMMKGEHLDMQFSKNTKKKVRWSSLKPAVASVSKEGVVRAKKKGNTIIKARFKGEIYLCKLTVTPKEKSIIYLTFDDGPNRYSTPKVLKILKKNDVKATFFQLKPAKADFDLTKRVLDEGHALAMHGYQHKYDIIYQSVDTYRNNLDKQRKLFFNRFGVWCTVTRFPGGSSNTVSKYNPGVMTKITNKIHNWGYHYFDWNVSSGDAGGTKTASGVYKNVTSGLKKGRENVVLMHDFGGNDKTINALDRIIKYGKKHGYTFRTITASTTENHHAVNN